jgi:hypothetical protein
MLFLAIAVVSKIPAMDSNALAEADAVSKSKISATYATFRTKNLPLPARHPHPLAFTGMLGYKDGRRSF